VSRVFIDTSAFVALRNRSEQEHEASRSAFEQLVTRRESLFTSSYVFSETYTALLVRVGREEAVTWGRLMRAGSAIEIVTIDDDLAEDAWRLLENHEDKAWSHVDATSFALMERERSTVAFAFDRHFERRGLQVIPGRGG
jgi:predicted nucleic acid-binding protein